jgi:hypothetical protein
MKSLLIAILCFAAFKGFSQTSDLKVEERSSDWIKISSTTTSAKPRTATATKKKNSSNKSVPKKEVQEEFEKTNNEVNRFKKKN